MVRKLQFGVLALALASCQMIPEDVDPTGQIGELLPKKNGDNWVIYPTGFSDVEIGSSYDDVKARHPLELFYSSENPAGDLASGQGCETFGMGNAYPGVSLMFEDGTLTRIDIYRPYDDATDQEMAPLPHQTLAGAKVGTTRARLKMLYAGQLESEPHHYQPEEGTYEKIIAPGGTLGTLFEVIDDKVTTFRVGQVNSIGYVEGCL